MSELWNLWRFETKGSLASVRGRLHSFGGRAVCLSDCRLQGNSKEKQQRNSRETGNGKPSKT
jgi:hypothetical protein